MASDQSPLSKWDPKGENVDLMTFEQILEMDDDEDERDFSKGIVIGFFEQAETTFKNMDDALETGDLENLSQLGHFLKGSSATLGLVKVRDSCEKIQHYGHQKEDANAAQGAHPKDWYLDRLKSTVAQVRKEYQAAEKVLKGFYGEK